MKEIEQNMPDGMSMHVENMPEQSIVYMRRTGMYGMENQALMEQFKTWVMQHNLFTEDAVILGIALDDARCTKPEECRYDTCLIVSGQLNSESLRAAVKNNCLDTNTKMGYLPINERTLPGGKYVVLVLPHTAEAVQKAWTEALPTLIDMGYVPDTARPIIERYSKKMIDRHYCELCVPILDTP